MFPLCSNFTICENLPDGTNATSQKATLQHTGVSYIYVIRSFWKHTMPPHNSNRQAPFTANKLILTDLVTKLFDHS